MKTTLEIPDELMRRVRVRAAENNRKLKDIVAELLESGMDSAAAKEKRRMLPIPVKLKGGPLSVDEIENAIAEGRA